MRFTFRIAVASSLIKCCFVYLQLIKSLHIVQNISGSLRRCPCPTDRKKVLTTFLFIFLVLNLFDRGVKWFITGKTCSGVRENNIFQGVQMLIPMETYRTCNFPGWVRTPICTCKTEDCYNDNWAKKTCVFQVT